MKLFVDLDGVLADFDKEFLSRFGNTPEHFRKCGKVEEKKHWRHLANHILHGDFYGSLELMPDAMILMNFVKQYDPAILSATGTQHPQVVASQKMRWVKHHLGEMEMHYVRTSADKAGFSTPDSILIDDREKSINPWVAAGGIGILHKNAAQTISELKTILENIVEEDVSFLKFMAGI